MDSFGIGIEKEIYSSSYFSYHYGYRNLKQIPERKPNSKLFTIENIIKEKFENIPFQIIFLNFSSRGIFVNFTLKDEKDRSKLNELGIVPIQQTNSFSFNLHNIGSNDIIHREIFPKANLEDFNVEKKTKDVANEIIKNFLTVFYCVGFDGQNGTLNTNELHLELYPEKHIPGMEDFLNNLKKFQIDTIPFKKYFLDFRKFSHLKFRILDGQIKNIKYYRSINVNIPQFYYE
jgi:hypothetical protein